MFWKYYFQQHTFFMLFKQWCIMQYSLLQYKVVYLISVLQYYFYVKKISKQFKESIFVRLQFLIDKTLFIYGTVPKSLKLKRIIDIEKDRELYYELITAPAPVVQNLNFFDILGLIIKQILSRKKKHIKRFSKFYSRFSYVILHYSLIIL